MHSFSSQTFCGRTFSPDEIRQIKEMIDICSGLSRTELANTVCELFDWKRPTGKLKTVECFQFLEDLHTRGIIKLPDHRPRQSKKGRHKIKRTSRGKIGSPVTGSIKMLLPLRLCRVTNKTQRDLWYEYVDRYHYMGYQLPFGAQVRYFIESRQARLLGCLQFSSPAWKMAPRDRWIGWSKEQRKRNLQRIVNNSRFLILPWVRVKNLASATLALAVRTVPDDWRNSYGYNPVLMETLVETSLFTGTSYKAANWTYLGATTGRGRMDRRNARQGQRPKDIYVYPLSSRFRQELSED